MAGRAARLTNSPTHQLTNYIWFMSRIIFIGGTGRKRSNVPRCEVRGARCECEVRGATCGVDVAADDDDQRRTRGARGDQCKALRVLRVCAVRRLLFVAQSFDRVQAGGL